MTDKSIDNYIGKFPVGIQDILHRVREAILKTAPDAEETISYGIPTFKLNGKALVHFAAYKSHIGFYATPSGHHEFSDELSKYKQGKGSVQFPLDEPIPFDLIRRIVEFRVLQVQNLTKS